MSSDTCPRVGGNYPPFVLLPRFGSEPEMRFQVVSTLREGRQQDYARLGETGRDFTRSGRGSSRPRRAGGSSCELTQTRTHS
ncbi:hypothetical protein ElyMa_004645700 [Elysia marginata]|uniref:Uncharacterized protein n=1 Tax=Elysia marginata TaxID=1093978 RepID=A0AAV4I0Q0_9GAST|nr:hypothetical protein ElyMa_004645700 [Elysia marginata]